jgi:sigma-B regulation protein RsbU (phosphoserine phosphatase)
MRILVAEDDITSRLMLQGVLGKFGYLVTSARDGEEAWEILQQPDAPLLVVLDRIMPGMDGLTLCRKLRAQHHPEPFYILLLTSKAEPNDIVQGLDAGADDYIAKPYDTTELLARIGVGRRVLKLQAEVAMRQKLQGVLEMAGAICHELNQPLYVVSGYSEMLLQDMDENDPHAETIRTIKTEIDRIGEITRKIMHITQYRTKDYLGGQAIVDIQESSAVASSSSSFLKIGLSE